MDAAVQSLPLLRSQDNAGRYIGGQTREHARIQNAPGNHRIEAEQTLQSIEGLQLSRLDLAAAFEYSVPNLDAPAPGVPLQPLASLLGRFDGYGTEQHPFDCLDSGRRTHFAGPQCPQGNGLPCCASMAGGLQGNRTCPKTQFGHPCGLAGAPRQLQALLGQQRRLGQGRPDMALRAINSPIPGRAHQQIHAQSLCLGKELVHVAFAIGHAHQARSGQLLAQPRQRLHAVEPLETFLVLDGSQAPACLDTALLRISGPDPQTQHSQGQALGGEGQRPVTQQSPSIPIVHWPQAFGGAVPAIVDEGGVLHRQDYRLAAHALNAGSDMRSENSPRADILVIKEPIRRFECRSILQCLRQRHFRALSQRPGHSHQPRIASDIAQIRATELPAHPVGIHGRLDLLLGSVVFHSPIQKLTSHALVYNNSFK